MSQWGVPSLSHSRSPSGSETKPPPIEADDYTKSSSLPHVTAAPVADSSPIVASPEKRPESSHYSPQPRRRTSSRTGSRPSSMVQTFQPPLMDVAQDTLPELLPIFTYLNSHSNKLYQEGYFLKLHDLDPRGRPSSDRNWTECFAQLVGTVMSVWDAAELDAVGDGGEVKPAFINIADASIKMLESLPMNENGGRPLQNVLSVSTAGNNRYLFHFSTFASMTQWASAIRLAIYENTTLQEAYTGSLIAGKGKNLNNIRMIMERSRFKYEDWARVRFGAGTPWRKCWFVISPPDQKEYEKLQKSMKKRGPYEKAPVLRGDLKFYETKKIGKKTRPIATITDAYSAYAIYPASKPLIEQSTLVKIEGNITVHDKSGGSSTEGSVFVMPETHPAISGFEMMLKFLFPVWDTFAIYGRPNRLIADVRDARGLMFAMPKDRHYGYLETLDVAGLVNTEGSGNWGEREWRKELKDLTAKRMMVVAEGGDRDSIMSNGRANGSRTSLPPTRSNRLRFDESASGRSTPNGPENINRNNMSPIKPLPGALSHRRSHSEALGYNRNAPNQQGRFTPGYEEVESPPAPPLHQQANFVPGMGAPDGLDKFETASDSSKESGERTPERNIPPEVQALTQRSPPPQPVAAPPAMAHGPGERPSQRQNLRPGQANLDQATLSQLEDISSGRQQPRHQSPNRFGPPLQQQGQQGQHGQYPNQRSSWGSQDDGQSRVMMQNQYSSSPQQKSRYPPPRLATIPASPFIDQAASPGSATTPSSYFQQTQASIPEGAALRPVMPPPTGSSSNISRMPIGAAAGPPLEGSRPSTANSIHSEIRSGSPLRQGSPSKRMEPAYGSNLGGPYAPQLLPHGQMGPPPPPIHQGQGGYPNTINANPVSPPVLPPGGQYGGPPPQNFGPGPQQLPLGQPRPPQHGGMGPYGPIVNQNPQGLPLASPPISEGLSPIDQTGSSMYGGQMLPMQTVEAMKKRDLRMYGPSHVHAMERMAPVSAFRGQSAGQISPPANNNDATYVPPRNQWA
ncbi:hypothetical protein BT63DRAFT_450253 [Microthyrium microscopicum]|uniref:PH domain-containing protein n=1 Tax=Microthyrium microscopicum TaxID=703497 RepID=A0A6A6UUZ0_9PEZI|nr:hypothetical protein BT63DRAFT_450253 [Microthyrium microscopicum]